ncbi:MAG TPA: hypothetical protein PLE25_07625 [Spirochaetales bacterium]|nr:hypothetical protein [Spirochaetales bacterium]
MERAGRGSLTRGGPRWTALAIAAGVSATLGVAAIVAIALSLRPGSDRSFGALLARIDASPVTASAEAYLNAAALAKGSEDRLRVLKRAALRDSALYADVAAVMTGSPVSQPVALAALDAYLKAGRFVEALSLFDGPLDPRTNAAALAETVVTAARAGRALSPSIDQLVACFDATGDSSFLTSAAIDAMRKGDRQAASMLLRDAELAPYRLLWDAMALETLARRVPVSEEPLELAVRADAERLLGETVAATASYAFIVTNYPDWSWKPYASLARLCGVEGASAAPRWPYSAVPGSSESLASPTALAERLHGEMLGRFSDDSDAVIERASWLYDNDRSAEASSLLVGLEGERASIARLAYGSPDRAVPDAARLAATYPLSAAAVDAALGAFASAGSWDRFVAALGEASAAELPLPRLWFWEAVYSALNGEPAQAAEAIRRNGGALSDYASAYDIGILELAAGDYRAAADALGAAAAIAGSAEAMAKAYVLLGDALSEQRLTREARGAYEAALGADPGSRDARSKLYRLDASP